YYKADNDEGTTHPVGVLRSNAWGLYDMHGNVWEWIQDWYDSGEYARRVAAGTPIVDPAGPAAPGSYRVNRGGSWFHDARVCWSAFRNFDAPGTRNDHLGFRLL